MKIIFAAVASLIIVFGSVSCETTPPQEVSESVVTPPNPYPLETCLVTDEGLESKGGSFTLIHEGQEVKVCCVACKMAFKSEPELYLAKLP